MIVQVSHNIIAAFNRALVANRIAITPVEYFKEVARRFYPTMDISFADELMDMSSLHDICVPHKRLFDFKVVKNDLNDVKRAIGMSKLVEGVDYVKVVTCDETTNNVPEDGFMLHPHAFKQLLMQAKDTLKYCEYYILLGECFADYIDYEMMLRAARLQTTMAQ